MPVLRGMLLGQFSPSSPASYRAWVRRHDTLTADDRASIRARIARLPGRVLSLVMAPGHADPRLVVDAAAALVAQLYPHWDLSIGVADAAAEARLAGVVADPRIRIVALAELEQAALGGFVAVLPPDARLAPHALFEIAAELAAHPETDLLYTDEDRLDRTGRRRDPLFKTAWSADLLLGQDALGDLVMVRRSALSRAGGLGDVAAAHDRALRLAEAIAPARIRHIPAVLVHRSAAPGPRAADAGAVARHLRRTGRTGTVVARLSGGRLRVLRPLPARPPLVSVIVPNRDAAGLLAQVTSAVLERTDYPAIEMVIADNGSTDPAALALLERLAADARVRVVSLPGPFNYADLNNQAVRHARGEVLVLLNNDVDVIDPGWLQEMVSHAVRPEIGAVGAKLLYADGRLQHGGVALGVSGVAGHIELLAARDAPGYGDRLALTRDVAAVTAACLAMRRDVFDAVGGLDARNLAVAYNDVDLCLRVREAGWRVLWTPFAELYHLESASRPFDLAPAQLARYQREVAYMHRRWGDALRHDPFYGENFSLRDGFHTLAAPRRVAPWRMPPGGEERVAPLPAAPVFARVSSGD